MLERYVHQCRVIRFPCDPDAEREVIADWREELGPRPTRRMSPLGLAVAATLRGHAFEDDPALIYTTTFTETRALEGFIDSFPNPSPLLFQMSIHPGGAEQAMIARHQAVTEFFPLAGEDEIISQALKTAFLSPRPRTVWIGGEERGSWLLDAQSSGPATFAWALALDQVSRGAVARVKWDPGAIVDKRLAARSTFGFCEALETREDLRWGGPDIGLFHWNWL